MAAAPGLFGGAIKSARVLSDRELTTSVRSDIENHSYFHAERQMTTKSSTRAARPYPQRASATPVEEHPDTRINVSHLCSNKRPGRGNAPVTPSRRDNFLAAYRPEGRPATPIWRLAALAFLLALGFVSPCVAGTYRISGTITDALGRPLPQVSLELRDQNGAPIAHATTDHAGRFKIAPTKPGFYSLLAVKPGFNPANKILRLSRTVGSDDLDDA